MKWTNNIIGLQAFQHNVDLSQVDTPRIPISPSVKRVQVEPYQKEPPTTTHFPTDIDLYLTMDLDDLYEACAPMRNCE